jgi:hypothetical protein
MTTLVSWLAGDDAQRHVGEDGADDAGVAEGIQGDLGRIAARARLRQREADEPGLRFRAES